MSPRRRRLAASRHRARSRRRIPLALVSAVALLAVGSACDDAAAPETRPPTADEQAAASSTTTTSTTEAVPGPLSDQTPPSSTFGIDFNDNQLWVVDFYRGEILVVDPDSGTILRRLKSEDNVSDEVDDIAVDDDGTVYWAGYNDGAVGRVTATNVGQVITRTDPGVCGLALSPDGKMLYVGGSMTGPAPLREIDPLNPDHRVEIAPALDIRAFAVAPSGKLYGPRYGSTEPGATTGALVEVDPEDGLVAEVATGLDSPIAADVSADGRTVYVLSLPNGKGPTLQSVEVTTGIVTPMASPLTPLAANLVAAPDGRIFVSSYNTSDVSVISKDGTVKTLAIGQKRVAR